MSESYHATTASPDAFSDACAIACIAPGNTCSTRPHFGCVTRAARRAAALARMLERTEGRENMNTTAVVSSMNTRRALGASSRRLVSLVATLLLITGLVGCGRASAQAGSAASAPHTTSSSRQVCVAGGHDPCYLLATATAQPTSREICVPGGRDPCYLLLPRR